MSNGYTAPPIKQQSYDPWNQQQQGPTWQQWDQPSRQPPLQVHRGHGHHRNRSLGYGNNPPYRILHSYNSPAYRNAPIWG